MSGSHESARVTGTSEEADGARTAAAQSANAGGAAGPTAAKRIRLVVS